MSELTVRCPGCKRSFAAENFVRDRTKIHRGGVGTYCLECSRERSKSYYKRVREQKLVRYREKVLAERGPRMCAKGCGRRATSQRHIYCGACRQQAIDDRLQRRGKMSMWGLMIARERDARRTARRRELGLTAKARGYDEHYRRRRLLEEGRFDRGEVVCCARCHLRIKPGQVWDLGHDDLDRSQIVGPEHRYSADCPAGGNRATARHRVERERAFS